MSNKTKDESSFNTAMESLDWLENWLDNELEKQAKAKINKQLENKAKRRDKLT